MADVKRITILGATGSIGGSTADVIMAHPGRYDVHAVTANNNAKKLAGIALRLQARQAVIADEAAYDELKTLLAGSGIAVSAGRAALLDVCAEPVDIVMAGIVGMAGLEPVMQAIGSSRIVAIANKEPLVAAGALVMNAARKHGTTLLPVDSEHNAIFQVFESAQRAHIEKLILTASGGPFRTWSKEQIASATPAQAVAHPNWTMGAKISVDSASLMNKALEVIEAHYLFAMPPEKIDVIVHPQSVIHSMVEYSDGSVLAQLGAPDMRTPISYALGWPDRLATPGQKLDLKALSRLDFEAPDTARFPALALAYESLQRGPAACVALNAANEVAVAAFLDKKIGFQQIFFTIKQAVDAAGGAALDSLAEIIAYDQAVRTQAMDYINQHSDYSLNTHTGTGL